MTDGEQNCVVGHTDLWRTRRQAEAALDGSLKVYAEVLRRAIAILDDCCSKIQALNTPLGRVCSLTLIKGKNLGLGCYSLMLDGLGQEAGALLRPLIECMELIRFLADDHARVERVLSERPPTAGEIARAVNGQFQTLRSHLNKNASHFSVTPEATAHIVDLDAGAVRFEQLYSEVTLSKNMAVLALFLVGLADSAVHCLHSAGSRIEPPFGKTILSVYADACALCEFTSDETSVASITEEI